VVSVSQLTFASGSQTQKEIYVHNERYSLSGISPLTGQAINTEEYLLIERLIVKLVDGEIQLEKTLELTHAK